MLQSWERSIVVGDRMRVDGSEILMVADRGLIRGAPRETRVNAKVRSALARRCPIHHTERASRPLLTLQLSTLAVYATARLQMTRREFIAGISAAVWPLAARAQQ
jgi:hypothetical protein